MQLDTAQFLYYDRNCKGGMSAVKISTKSRYALHLMLALAMQEDGVNLSVKSVAESQGISEKYLEQVIPTLIKGGMVRSTRGARGGYHLVGSPEDYTVGDILRLVEGSIAPVSCLDDEVNQCARCKECVTLELWEQVDRAISNVVDHVTLADLMDKQRRIDARCSCHSRGNC